MTTVEDHDQDEVDLLEVLDQRVSTAVALTNISSAFWPSRLTSPPVVELDEPVEEAREADERAGGEGRTKTTEELEMELLVAEEENDPLAAHLAVVLKKQRRKEKSRAALLGIWSFLKTPLGVAAAIYGLNVVVWGAGLVLLLMIPMNSYDKKLWVEVCSQVLTGLFNITSLLPLPWRLYDAYQVSIIYSYQRRTRERRKELGLPPLRDPNDLPEPEDADYWVGPGGERLTGPRPLPTIQPPREKKKASKGGASTAVTPAGTTPTDGTPTGPGTPTAERPHDVELAAMETKVGASPTGEGCEDEVPVLTDREEDRLRRAQLKFGRSQNWYRAHSTPTHHAFPISQALLITLFTLTNSLLQIALCGVMYGLNRFNRPSALTACLIVASFLCGIVAAVLIWQCGERTKKKAEVSRRVWIMLKKDEEELLDRKKEAMEARVAKKEEKGGHKGGLAGVLGRISLDGQRKEGREGVRPSGEFQRVETVQE